MKGSNVCIVNAISKRNTVPELLQQVDVLLHQVYDSTEIASLDLDLVLFNQLAVVNDANILGSQESDHQSISYRISTNGEFQNNQFYSHLDVSNRKLMVLFLDIVNYITEQDNNYIPDQIAPSLMIQHRKKWFLVGDLKKVTTFLPYWRCYQLARQ